MNERILPQAPEAEQELLRCVWIEPRVLDDVRELVSPGNFYHLAHEHLWEAFLACYDQHGKVDFPILRETLRRRGTPNYDMVLGASIDGAGTVSMAEVYARRVRDAARLRAVIDACDGVSRQACSEPPWDDVEGFACRAEDSVRRAAEQGSSDTYVPASRVQGVFDRIVAIKQGHATESELEWIDIGWPYLAEITNGLPRTIVAVMGRPGMGKTAWCVSVALTVALMGGKVFISSLELPEAELFTRLLSLVSGIPYVVLSGKSDLSPEDWQRLSDAAAKISGLDLAMDCEPGLTASQIAVRGARARRKLGGLDIHVVDHFHIMAHPSAARNERLDTSMGRSSGVLANYVKRANVCMLLATQVNRECEGRLNKVPIESDLRECGTLEQDAKMMVAPYRPWVYDKNESSEFAQLWIRKNRGGPTDVINMRFQPGTMRFSEDAGRVQSVAEQMGMRR